jgi:hypothetical protein
MLETIERPAEAIPAVTPKTAHPGHHRRGERNANDDLLHLLGSVLDELPWRRAGDDAQAGQRPQRREVEGIGEPAGAMSAIEDMKDAVTLFI